MNSDSIWTRAKRVFADALERPPSERVEFVSRHCEGIAELQSRVEDLLKAHDRMGEFLRPPDAPDLVEEVPEVIAHYRVERELGRGGMGTVYLAEDTRLGREVAIKRLPDDCFMDPKRRALFEREARTAAHLNHPNIATIYELGEEDERTHIAMEHVPGCSLGEYLRESGALSVEEALEIAIQIAQGLQAAHQNGIIHRDLKPGNLMITEEGRVKILDFGLAKAVQSEALDGGSVKPRTADGSTMGAGFLGTVGYSSPEQSSGGVVDARSDLFSFGVILHEMLTGEAPFRRDTPTDTLKAVLHDGVPDRDNGRAGLPYDLISILDRLLPKDPEERYADTGELLEDLLAVRARLRGGWRRWLWPLATAAAVVVAVVMFVGGGAEDLPPEVVLSQYISLQEWEKARHEFQELAKDWEDQDPRLDTFRRDLVGHAKRLLVDLERELEKELQEEGDGPGADEIHQRIVAAVGAWQIEELGDWLKYLDPIPAAERMRQDATTLQGELPEVTGFQSSLASGALNLEDASEEILRVGEVTFRGAGFSPARQRAAELEQALARHLRTLVARSDEFLGSLPLAEQLQKLQEWQRHLERLRPGDASLQSLAPKIQAVKVTVRLGEWRDQARELESEVDLRPILELMQAESATASQTQEVECLVRCTKAWSGGVDAFREQSMATLGLMVADLSTAVADLDGPVGVRWGRRQEQLVEARAWLADLDSLEAPEDPDRWESGLEALPDPSTLAPPFQDAATRYLAGAERRIQIARGEEATQQRIDRLLADVKARCEELDLTSADDCLAQLQALGVAVPPRELEAAREGIEALRANQAEWKSKEREELTAFLGLLSRSKGVDDVAVELRGLQQVWREELEFLQRALDRTEHLAHRLRSARLHLRLGKLEACLKDLEKAPDSVEGLLLKAQAVFARDPEDRSNVLKAVGILEQASEDLPLGSHRPRFSYLLGSYRVSLDLQDQAVESLRSAVSQGHASMDAYYQIAELTLDGEDWTRARENATKAMESGFFEEDVLHALGGFQAAVRPGALEEYHANLLVARAEALYWERDSLASLRDCEQACNLAEHLPWPLCLRGMVRLAVDPDKNRKRAVDDLGRARQLAREDLTDPRNRDVVAIVDELEKESLPELSTWPDKRDD